MQDTLSTVYSVQCTLNHKDRSPENKNKNKLYTIQCKVTR